MADDIKDKTLRRILSLTIVIQRVVQRSVMVAMDSTTPIEYLKQELVEALHQLVKLANEWINDIETK